jgi:hypothetical protein
LQEGFARGIICVQKKSPGGKAGAGRNQMENRRAKGKRKAQATARIFKRWAARLEKAGLTEWLKEDPPDDRRKELAFEQDAAFNFDGSARVWRNELPDQTESVPAVSKGAWLELAEHLKLDGVGRTVLVMRFWLGATRKDVRAHYKRDNPGRISEAMTAWREFSERMPEIRTFLKKYRNDRLQPLKPKYRLFE